MSIYPLLHQAIYPLLYQAIYPPIHQAIYSLLHKAIYLLLYQANVTSDKLNIILMELLPLFIGCFVYWLVSGCFSTKFGSYSKGVYRMHGMNMYGHNCELKNDSEKRGGGEESSWT